MDVLQCCLLAEGIITQTSTLELYTPTRGQMSAMVVFGLEAGVRGEGEWPMAERSAELPG